MPKKVNGYLYSDAEVIAEDYQAEGENNLCPEIDVQDVMYNIEVPGKARQKKIRACKAFTGSPADSGDVPADIGTSATDEGSFVSKLSKEALTALEMSTNVSDIKKVEEYLRKQLDFNGRIT